MFDEAAYYYKNSVLMEVRKNGYALSDASERLKNDKEVVLAAVTSSGWALKYASENLKDDKEVVLAAVTNSGWALQYASKNLKDDKEVVLTAVTGTGYALQYASERLKNDKEVVLIAVKRCGDILPEVSENLKDDKEVVLAAVREYGYLLRCASENLKDDVEVVLAAVKEYGWAFEYASERLKDDEEVVLAAIKINALALKYANERLKNDKKFILRAIKIKPNILHYIGDKIKDDKEFEIYRLLDLEFLEKLKSRYYKSYVEKVVSKDKTKDNIVDFYKTMMMSNVLLDIYSSSFYSINDIRSIERSLKIFDKKEQDYLLNKIKVLVQKNRNDSINLFNKLISCKDQKEKMDEVLENNKFNSDTVVQFVLNNKYLDKLQKTALLKIIFQIYDSSKIIKVGDIFELLEEMELRNLTIEEILKEKEIDKKLFYKIYETAKNNNPLLFNHIKDTLARNKIRGFKKFLAKGYAILNSKFETLVEYEEKYDINIYDFIETYNGTELYEKLINKFSLMEGFEINLKKI